MSKTDQVKIDFLISQFAEMVKGSGTELDLKELNDEESFTQTTFLCFMAGWEFCERYLIAEFNKQNNKCLCGRVLKISDIEITVSDA